MSAWDGTVVIEGGGGGGAYSPYNYDENANDLDTAIAALTPWAYWKLDESSGTPQDSSGNGRHATGIADATYSQAPISDKGNNSIRFGTFGGRVSVPAPVANMGAVSVYWTVTFLCMVEAIFASGSGTSGVSNIAEQGNGSNQSDWKIGVQDSVNAFCITSQNNNIEGGTGNFGATIVNQPVMIGLVGSLVNNLYWALDVWVNGVRWASTPRGGTVGGSQGMHFGRSAYTVWAWTQSRYSNIAAWDSTLTDAQMVALSADYMDATMLAAAYTP